MGSGLLLLAWRAAPWGGGGGRSRRRRRRSCQTSEVDRRQKKDVQDDGGRAEVDDTWDGEREDVTVGRGRYFEDVRTAGQRDSVHACVSSG